MDMQARHAFCSTKTLPSSTIYWEISHKAKHTFARSISTNLPPQNLIDVIV